MLEKLIQSRLQDRVRIIVPDANLATVLVRPCPDLKFGDYQSNALMAIAKERKRNPRQLAEEVVAGLDVSEWCEPIEIAGAGFLNFRVKTNAVTDVLKSAYRGEHLFFERSATPRTVIVDFSSPNVAKPMHVGHIRSTILGDSLVRALRLLGHHVVTDNHIGDWGTQFGKLLVGWKKDLDRTNLERDPLAEMGRLYKQVNASFETDEEIKTQARQELVSLQSGDEENLKIWREMIDLSLQEFGKVYLRLGIRFDHVLGESFYNPQLKAVAKNLVDVGIAQESEGATVVFFDESTGWKDPAIILKSDGGANYTTTDLATLEYRLKTWQPSEIVYVTDARQQLHFQQLFHIYRRWHPSADVSLSHIWFGMILGPDGTPFKTRTGENIELNALLNEAEERALASVTEKNPDLSENERLEIARVVGIGAVKYSDLLPNRQSDYRFDWDKMLALTGNTAVYLLYAYTRIRSVGRKAAEVGATASVEALQLTLPSELTLAKHLLRFGLSVEAMASEYRPNYLCNYLFELAGLFSQFYENCPVLKAEAQERASRLALCELAGRVLKQGLEILGIETTERM